MVDRLAGDQATVLFVPGFAGADHRQHAIKAAEELLEAIGHNQSNGPWSPVGIGSHTGVAFVGSVGSEGTATHITVVGDPANVAARLSSTAKAGEILISRDAATPELDEEHLETRELELKGKSQKVGVCVLKRSSQEHW